MRITLTMSTDIIHFRNFSISRIPARLLLPFSITASKGSIQRTAWQYVIELAAAVLSSVALVFPVSGCIALARKRYAYLSSPPATSAGTGRSQVFSRRRISRYSMTVFSVPASISELRRLAFSAIWLNRLKLKACVVITVACSALSLRNTRFSLCSVSRAERLRTSNTAKHCNNDYDSHQQNRNNRNFSGFHQNTPGTDTGMPGLSGPSPSPRT